MSMSGGRWSKAKQVKVNAEAKWKRELTWGSGRLRMWSSSCKAQDIQAAVAWQIGWGRLNMIRCSITDSITNMMMIHLMGICSIETTCCVILWQVFHISVATRPSSSLLKR